ncbi:MAG TPA: glutamate synthase large subunit [Verrucomicrobiae bacterium]|nr:glutamate synthase large subunit [Verrucomicrobiae bacterium]
MPPATTPSLYDPKFEHDACGVGFVANINGRREHRILACALQALANLAHRGALDADASTGDGSGVLAQLPHPFFRREMERCGGTLRSDSDLAVGMVFLPHDSRQAEDCRRGIEQAVATFDLNLLGWRPVPINLSALGQKAGNTLPKIEQILVSRPEGCDDGEFERRLFLARKTAENRIRDQKIPGFYIPSFSSRTIVYKGLLNAPDLGRFYRDLQDPLFETALAIFHQRYSTNTFPNWQLAHPFRVLAHNGEINTLPGNQIWTRAREQELASPVWGDRIDLLKPILQPDGSDSANLDNVLEVLQLSGRDILHSVMMLVPEAWENNDDLPPALKGFYRFHACLNEPWDGPAALVFSDGRYIGAALDRNGLRPARYKIYDDGLMVLASEAGVLPLDEKRVTVKGRLGPGEIIAIDTQTGKLLLDETIKARVAGRKPYAEWCRRQIFPLSSHAVNFALPANGEADVPDLTRRHILFGWDAEELREMLKPMVTNGDEPIGSMGDDTPLAVFSKRPRLLYDYFKQRFAQVTNPPMDSIREKIVMSLTTLLGRRRSWLTESEAHAKLVELDSPFLCDHELQALRNIADPAFRSETIYCHFNADQGAEQLETALQAICAQAERAVDAGKTILVLSDRQADETKVPVPMLLAAGAVHHHLLRRGKRLRASIVCESGEVRDVHQFACLIGYGASAVHPWLTIETIRQKVAAGEWGELTFAQALANFRNAIEHGLMKVMAKMGISTISSYRGAQVFEAIGVSSEVIDRCFHGTTSAIGGVTFRQIAEDALRRHRAAYGPPEAPALEEGGNFRVARNGQGEFHATNLQVVTALHRFTKTGSFEEFAKYLETVERRVPVAPRDLLKFKTTTPIPLEEVEPIEKIRRRFTTAGMSLGALSPEAHECLAIAMNSIGGKSNSGEGGEDPARYKVRPNGQNANSAIKQVASGRFGVTPEYLASAQELEIKMAQGSKPGEGGQLPGHKVSPLIAKLRHSVPGVTLISPPPHHDIYSIEDLAQLIYDLKQANPRAKICVKLVAESGVGTIAAGVAKAAADIILISGHDGGTGASPLSSIKHAGCPFEFGIAEAHQTLRLNGLRSRVTLRTDGGLKTGRDIVLAAILGAQEFNFGTAALIAAGCAMFRICHTNRCPVGVATQDEELRKKYRGKPENVVAFFNGVAQEVREILARLGCRTLNEVIGRTDLLERRPLEDFPEEIRGKIASVNLDRLLYQVEATDTIPPSHPRNRNERFGDAAWDDKIIADARPALLEGRPVRLTYFINNTQRSLGTHLSGRIAQLFGDRGLPDGTIDITLHGSAGQSFGAFLANGVRLRLFGEANDYVGKGMNGGEIILRPADDCKLIWSENVLLGNTVMYGATGGRLFAAGLAGERFAVRNCGGVAVVEGVGDHGCEYMTAGIVVVLGRTGRNFAAGMSGGRAYVFDPQNDFPARCHRAMVAWERLSDPVEVQRLQALIQAHGEKTGSPRAADILRHWPETVKHFWRVVPRAAPIPSEPARLLERVEAKASALVDGVGGDVALLVVQTKKIR